MKQRHDWLTQTIASCGEMIVRPVTRAMEWQKPGHVKRSKCVAACVTGHDTVMPIKKESYSYVLLTLSGSFC